MHDGMPLGNSFGQGNVATRGLIELRRGNDQFASATADSCSARQAIR